MFPILQQGSTTKKKKNNIETTPPMEHNNKIKPIKLRGPRQLNTNTQSFPHNWTANKPHTNTQNYKHTTTTQNNQNHFVDGHAQTQNKTLNYVDYFHKQTPQIK